MYWLKPYPCNEKLSSQTGAPSSGVLRFQPLRSESIKHESRVGNPFARLIRPSYSTTPRVTRARAYPIPVVPIPEPRGLAAFRGAVAVERIARIGYRQLMQQITALGVVLVAQGGHCQQQLGEGL